jgi:hypothetical protein
MLDLCRIEIRSAALLPRKRVPAALVVLLTAVWLAMETANCQPLSSAPQIEQPKWYVTNNQSGFGPAEPTSRPEVSTAISQPTFIAPAGSAAPPAPIVIAAESQWSVAQPRESSSPSAIVAEPAPIAEPTSRWGTIWKQIAGRRPAASPLPPQIATNSKFVRSEPGKRDAATTNVSPPRVETREFGPAQFAGQLIQQATGTAASSQSAFTANDTQQPTPETPFAAIPTIVTRTAAVDAAPSAAKPESIRTLPPPTDAIPSVVDTAGTLPVEIPAPAPATQQLAPNVAAAAPAAPYPSTDPTHFPAASAPTPTVPTISTPAPTVASNGDPLLNKIADAAAGATKQSGSVASLLKPLVGTTVAAPAAPNLPPASVAPSAPNNAETSDRTVRQGNLPNPAAEQMPAVRTAASSLWRQLTMSSNDDLRKPPAASNTPIQPEQQTWDGGWTGSIGTFPNPFTTAANTGRAQQAVGNGAINTASLVAFFQEGELIPEPQPADIDVQTGETVQPGQGGNAAGNGQQADSLSEAERLGSEPEDNSLQFLRTATVLLEPGESQWDVGIEYALAETDFPILLVNGMGNIVGVADAKFRVRELSVPIEYRTGLHRRVQGFVSVPLGWANTQVSVNNEEAFRNDGGLGDVNFGLTMQLVDAKVDSPYWVTTLSATAPTGGDPFTGLSGIAPSAPSLGQGFWSIQGNLLLIQPYDPIVVFYGVGMQRSFEHEYIGLDIQPGAEYSYSMGVGFAVNDRVTLSARFRGAYVEETEVEGLRVIGSNAEPMTIRLAATISKPCERIVEPFVEFGMTEDSVAGFFGVTWTFQPDAHKKKGTHENSSTQAKPQPQQNGGPQPANGGTQQ